MGCRASDHSLDYAMYVPATAAEIEDIFASALAGEDITYEEDLKFKTAFLLFIGRSGACVQDGQQSWLHSCRI